MSIIIWIIILLYFLKTTSFVTLCCVYYHYRYQCTCDVIPPNAPSKEMGYWNEIILHTACVFIDPTQGVPFKISMGPIVRAAIIEKAPKRSVEACSNVRWFLNR